MAADVDSGYSIFRSKGDAASAAAAAAEFETQTSASAGTAPITSLHQVDSAKRGLHNNINQ